MDSRYFDTDEEIPGQDEQADKLLQLVAASDLAAVAQFLALLRNINQRCFNDGRIAYKFRPFTDTTGHTWPAISPLFYAVWAGDIFMFRCIQSFLPYNPRGWDIPEMKTECSFARDDKVNGAVLAPLLNLINAYKDFIANQDTWTDDEREKQFKEIVGNAQGKLPIYIIHEICGAQVFYPPRFEDDPRRECSYYGANGQLISFSPQDLGKNLALSRSIWKGATAGPRWVEDDLYSLIYFYNKRIQAICLQIGESEAKLIDSLDNKYYEYNREDFLIAANLIGMKNYGKEEIKSEIDYDKRIGWISNVSGKDTYEEKERTWQHVLGLSYQFMHMKIPKSFSVQQLKEMKSFHQAMKNYFYSYADGFKKTTLALYRVGENYDIAEQQTRKMQEYEKLIAAKERVQNRNKLFGKLNATNEHNSKPGNFIK